MCAVEGTTPGGTQAGTRGTADLCWETGLEGSRTPVSEENNIDGRSSLET